VSLIGLPGTPPQSELATVGVARLSFGPWSQRVALTALADTGAELLSGASLPDGVRALT
jgi:2-methylisocitrate lyase-like PEP mutase family enzyme